MEGAAYYACDAALAAVVFKNFAEVPLSVYLAQDKETVRTIEHMRQHPVTAQMARALGMAGEGDITVGEACWLLSVLARTLNEAIDACECPGDGLKRLASTVNAMSRPLAQLGEPPQKRAPDADAKSPRRKKTVLLPYAKLVERRLGKIGTSSQMRAIGRFSALFEKDAELCLEILLNGNEHDPTEPAYRELMDVQASYEMSTYSLGFMHENMHALQGLPEFPRAGWVMCLLIAPIGALVESGALKNLPSAGQVPDRAMAELERRLSRAA